MKARRPPAVRLRLYVAGQTPKSIAALANIKRLCATGSSNIGNDLWINRRLDELCAMSLAGAGR